MANANGWGDGASNNNIAWGKGADNAIGWGSVYSVSSAGATDIVGTPAPPPTDPDAQAFITAASITDPTQQSAINTLVTDLKGYNIWTKFKAIYPIVGGVASSHAVNLKTPGTFNLTFSSGWTHTSNGMTPSVAYADTSLIPNSVLSLNSTHISGYIRNNIDSGGPILSSENAGSYDNGLYIWPKQNNTLYSVRVNDNTSDFAGVTYDVRGLHLAMRTGSNVKKYRVNTTQIFNSTTASSALNTSSIYIGKSRNNANYFNNQIAFSSIGDGLTDTESANFYTAVQSFQTTLGRSIGTQTVSDPDAQAFVNAANIVDQVEATAINNLVIGLKADSLWTKMNAIYPVVGGSASSHAVNLKTPGTFNLSFASGWTHSSNGMTPLNAYANTALIPNSVLTLNSTHISYYSRTNVAEGVYDMGTQTLGNDYLVLNAKNPANNFRVLVNDGAIGDFANSDSRGLFVANRTGASVRNSFVNGVKKLNDTTTATARSTNAIYLGALNNGGSAALYSTKQCAFASIGDGLTDTEAANFYTAVQAYQVTLGRSIGTQTVSDADAQAFVTAANITDQVEANAVNNLVIGMKADSLWTKMKAIYPVVGGVASSHAVNLKTPGTFNLTFASGWSHSLMGMTPSVSYANTGFNPLTQSLPRNSASMGVYNRTNTSVSGGHGQRVSNNFEMFDPWSDSRVYAYINNGASGFNVAVPNSLGLFQGSRTSSSAIAISQNTTISNGSSNTTGDSNGDLWIGASNDGGTGTFFNNRQIAFFYIGEGFDNTEMQNIYTRVQAYQTTLNRNV